MTDDIKEKLEAWGHWANDHGDSLDCKSPSAMLMRSAPFSDKADIPRIGAHSGYISDDDALMIDRAVGRLARHSVLLWSFIIKHYQYGMSVRQLAREHKCTAHKIKAYIERAIGFIDGCLANI